MTPLRWRWSLLLLAAVVGVVLFASLSSVPERAVLSFLGGLLLATVLFEISAFNIRYTERYLPNLTMAAAVFSYVMTALVLALVLAVSSPDVVHPEGIAAGLVASVVIWVGSEVAIRWVRSDAP